MKAALRKLYVVAFHCLSMTKSFTGVAPPLKARRSVGPHPSQLILHSNTYSSSDDQDFIEAAAAVTRDRESLLNTISIGVDYGTVKTGLAVSSGYNPRPLTILSSMDSTELASRVVDYCESERANQIVIGLPLHKNGTLSEQSNVTEVFTRILADEVGSRLGPSYPIYVWDERYTSKAAMALVSDPLRELSGALDADAACLILEDYYKQNGEEAQLFSVSEEKKVEYQALFEERERLKHAARMKEAESFSSRIQWRKEAIARDLIEGHESTSGPKKKKKKKKKKR